LNRAEKRRRNRASISEGLLYPLNIGEENLPLFEHVRYQILFELVESFLRLEQFRMVLSRS
jgi:hypothetical protein